MKQAVDPYASFRELTLRGIILGALITVILRHPMCIWA